MHNIGHTNALHVGATCNRSASTLRCICSQSSAVVLRLGVWMVATAGVGHALTVFDGLLRVERALRAGKALADNPRVLRDDEVLARRVV